MTYFVRIRGRAYGPFEKQQLQDMKTNGKLGRATEVSENRTDWQPAESYDFLFPDQGTSEPAKWYYSIDGTEGYGPVTRSTIVQKLQAGELRGESLVWQDGQNAQPIRNVPTFMEQSPVPPPSEQSFCTNCGAAVSKQAIACMSCGAKPAIHRNFCRVCATAVSPAQVVCVKCGSAIGSRRPSGGSTKSKIAAGLLGIFLGGLGVHKFYMGSWGWGLVFLLGEIFVLIPLAIVLFIVTLGLLFPLCLLIVYAPGITGLIEGIIYLCMSDEDFAAKYPPETQGPFRW